MARYRAQREEAIAVLGGKCVRCGRMDSLEFDHIDKDSKVFAIGHLLSVSRARYLEELAKCQLLCRPCHLLKTLDERGHRVARGTHGTISAYRYCKCEICRQAWKAYCKALRKRKRGELAEPGLSHPV